LVPRQLTMETVGILQAEGFGKLFQNRRPLFHEINADLWCKDDLLRLGQENRKFILSLEK